MLVLERAGSGIFDKEKTYLEGGMADHQAHVDLTEVEDKRNSCETLV